MDVTAYFTNNGLAVPGLHPTVSIVTTAGVSVVADASMTEIPNVSGWYRYNFSAYDRALNYIATSDAGTDAVDDRHPTSVSDDVREQTLAVWSYER